MTTERGAPPREAASSRSRSSGRSRCSRGTQRFRLSAARRRRDAPTSSGMVEEALQASREGSIFSRVARDITGGEEDAQVPPRVTYSTDAVSSWSRGSSEAEPARPRRRGRLPVAREGRRSRRAAVKAADAAAAGRAGARRSRAWTASVKAPVRILKPKVTQGELAEQVPGRAGRRPLQLRAAALQEPPAAEGVHGRGRRRSGFETPAGLYHIQNKAINPAWHVPNSDWAATSRARSSPAARPRTRSRRAGSASSTAPASTAPTQTYSLGTRGLARLHPDGDPGRDRALRPGAGRRARSISRRRHPPISSIGTSSQPCSSREACAAGVSNAERADEDPRSCFAARRTTSSTRRSAPGSGARA